MKLIAIDTSCDETAAAVTNNRKVLSNVIWSQASAHAEFGGVFPSLAKRMHAERIDWVVDQAVKRSRLKVEEVDAIAVTIGPGLAVSLEVGINKAKELAKKYKRPLIPVNHVEAHIFSPLLNSDIDIDSLLPCFGLVLSGGTTLLCLVKDFGNYEILAETQDDALGEALDKAARLLGLGYPGGEILEKFAKLGKVNSFDLPVPLIEDKEKNRFSYSGIKTAFVRLFNSIKEPSKQDLYNLSASFQNVAFKHVENVLEYQINNSSSDIKYLLFGGGVANNVEIKKRVRKICKNHKIKLLTPYNKRVNGDNAAMIGVCAYLKNKELTSKEMVNKYRKIDYIDRDPRMKIS